MVRFSFSFHYMYLNLILALLHQLEQRIEAHNLAQITLDEKRSELLSMETQLREVEDKYYNQSLQIQDKVSSELKVMLRSTMYSRSLICKTRFAIIMVVHICRSRPVTSRQFIGQILQPEVSILTSVYREIFAPFHFRLLIPSSSSWSVGKILTGWIFC